VPVVGLEDGERLLGRSAGHRSEALLLLCP
jgi:hypothetical protein